MTPYLPPLARVSLGPVNFAGEPAMIEPNSPTALPLVIETNDGFPESAFQIINGALLFMAPVTGRYQFNYVAEIQNVKRVIARVSSLGLSNDGDSRFSNPDGLAAVTLQASVTKILTLGEGDIVRSEVVHFEDGPRQMWYRSGNWLDVLFLG